MGLLASLFSRKTTDLPVPGSEDPRSLWKALDSHYDQLESQLPPQMSARGERDDIWDKLDDFYKQQEQRLGHCTTPTTF